MPQCDGMQQTRTIVILFKLGRGDSNQFRLVLGKHVEVQVGDALGEPTWVPASQSQALAPEVVTRMALQQLVDSASGALPSSMVFSSNANGRVTLDLGWVKL